MTETLARPVVSAAEERARLKEGVHIERSSRRVRTYFGGKLIADSEHVLLVAGRDAANVPMRRTFGPYTLVSFKVWTDEVS